MNRALKFGFNMECWLFLKVKPLKLLVLWFLHLKIVVIFSASEVKKITD